MSTIASEQSFRERYLKLLAELGRNEQQSKVVESRGHCVALAGPGSGKTKTITGKIARLLNEEIRSPRGVACITYSNECANEIQHRLSLLGIEPSERFFLGTVHGFCYTRIAKPYGHMAGMPIADRVVTDVEFRALRDIALREARLASDRTTRDAFDGLRREPLSRSDGWCRRWPALGQAVERYERTLADRGLTDFDEMVRIAVTLVHLHEWVRNVVRAKYPVVVVDEYQDLGYGLDKLVTKLRDGGVRLIAVGDPDQSIYGFAGAKPEWLHALYEHHAPRGEGVRLLRNYRCGQRIIDTAVAALGQPRAYLAEREDRGEVHAHVVPGGWQAQAAFAVEALLPRLVQQGINLGEVGFIYPDKHVCKAIADELAGRHIGFRGGRDIRYPRGRVIELIELAAQWAFLGIGSNDPPLSMLMARWRQVFQVEALGSPALAAKTAFVGYLWRNRSPSLPLNTWLDGLRASGRLDELLDDIPERDREQAALAGLAAATAPGAALDGWTVAEFARLGRKGELPHLITIHGSKGLEYDVAVVVGIDKMPAPDDPEERRKLYVAMTRARKGVHLLWTGAAPPLIQAVLARSGIIPTDKGGEVR